MAVRVAVPDARAVTVVGSPRDPGVQVSPAAFGAREAQATGQLGDVGMQIADRVMARNEAVANAEAYETANADIRQAMDTWDFSQANSSEEFGAFMRQKTDDMLTRTPGRAAAKVRLQNDLTDLRGRFASVAATQALQQGFERVQRTTDSQLRPLVDLAIRDPASVRDAMVDAERIYANAEAALPPGIRPQFRQNLRAQIAAGAIEGALASGDVDGAETLLSPEGGNLAEEMPIDQLSRARLQIRAQRIDSDKVGRELQQRMALIRQFAPGLSGEQQAAWALGMTMPKQEMTGEAKANAYLAQKRQFTGDPNATLTLEELQAAHDLDIETGGGLTFGTSVTGRSLDNFAYMTNAFASGNLSPEQDAFFVAGATDYVQPRTVKDETTGQWVTTRPELPAHVVAAFEERGIPIPQGATAPQPWMVGGGTSPSVSMAEGMPPSTGVVPAAAASGTPEPRVPAVLRTKVWDMAGENLTGPGPTVTAGAQKVPKIGELLPAESDVVVQQRETVSRMTRDLVRVLQSNPRYNEGERQSIAKEIDLSGQFWDNPRNYKNRLVGMDNALEFRQKEALDTLSGKFPTTAEDRQWALQALPNVIAFREFLGVPPLMSTPQEIVKAKEAGQIGQGDLVRLPDGRIQQIK
jgi:hypothetical protein